MPDMHQMPDNKQKLTDSKKRTLNIWLNAIFEYRRQLFISNCKTDEEKTGEDIEEEKHREGFIDGMLRELEKGLPKDILFSEHYSNSFYEYSRRYETPEKGYKICIAWLYDFPNKKVINMFFDVFGIIDGVDFFLEQRKRRFRDMKCPVCEENTCTVEIEEYEGENNKRSFLNVSCSCLEGPVKEQAILKAVRSIRDLANITQEARRYINKIRKLRYQENKKPLN